MNRVIPFVLLLAPTLSLAAEVPPAERPKSPAAVQAVIKADKAVADAEAAYRAAVAKARRAEVEELKAAQATAMQASNLAEANAIDAVAKQAQAEVIASKGGPPNVEWIAGTSWKFKDNKVIIRYQPGGVVEASSWAKPGTWTADGPASIVQAEPNTRTSVTFSPDRRHAFWIYANGEIAWAVRMD